MISPCEILQSDESKIRILRDSVKDDKNPKHTNQLESFVIKNFQCEICNYSNKKKRQMNLHIKTAHQTVKEFKCEICLSEFGNKMEKNGLAYDVYVKIFRLTPEQTK